MHTPSHGGSRPRVRAQLQCTCAFAVLLVVAFAAADQSAPTWIEVSSTEDIQTALAASAQQTFLQISDSLARCFLPSFQAYLHL